MSLYHSVLTLVIGVSCYLEQGIKTSVNISIKGVYIQIGRKSYGSHTLLIWCLNHGIQALCWQAQIYSTDGK
jgi:hypothetical protein